MAGNFSAAAPPCAARAKISIGADPDSPDHRNATVKQMTPARKMRCLPTTSPDRPRVIASAAWAI
jgi:hypothetical protein